MKAAQNAAPQEARKLHRMAVQQYFRSGRIEQGTPLAKSLLSAVGARWPMTHKQAIASIVWSKLALATRGLGYSLRQERELSVLALERLDALGSMFCELGVVDVVRGIALQLQFLREALAAGEPHSIVRGLAWEVRTPRSSGALATAARSAHPAAL